jgi:hypothetical protein
LDLRFTKKLRVGRARIEGNVDLYNVFSGSSILATNTRFGSAWLTPTQYSAAGGSSSAFK